MALTGEAIEGPYQRVCARVRACVKEPSVNQDSGVTVIQRLESQVVDKALSAVAVITRGCLQSTLVFEPAASVSGLIKVGLVYMVNIFLGCSARSACSQTSLLINAALEMEPKLTWCMFSQPSMDACSKWTKLTARFKEKCCRWAVKYCWCETWLMKRGCSEFQLRPSATVSHQLSQ